MWQVAINPAAREEAAWMAEYYPLYYARIAAGMEALCKLEDPRQAWDVAHLVKRWRGFYRLALYPEHTRVIFALYQGNRRVRHRDKVNPAENGKIEIVVCRFRKDAYAPTDRIARVA